MINLSTDLHLDKDVEAKGDYAQVLQQHRIEDNDVPKQTAEELGEDVEEIADTTSVHATSLQAP